MAIKTSTECQIPMARFLQIPLNLVLGSPILVRISSFNIIGWSEYSIVNPTTSRVQTVPLKPDTPYRGPLTNTN